MNISESTHLCYSVRIDNVGSKTITTSEIQLFKQDKGLSSIPENCYRKGTNCGYASYYKHPYNEVSVKWTVVETGKEHTQKVAIRLPKGFYNEEWLSEIIFYINPDSPKVWVAYKIFDEKEDGYVIVDSDGKPFPIDDCAEEE